MYSIPLETMGSPIKQDLSEKLKEQLRNKDRPANPMRKLESPGKETDSAKPSPKTVDDVRPNKSPDLKSRDAKEGILIEDNVQDNDTDSQEVSIIKDELEGSIGDTKSGRNSKEPDGDANLIQTEFDVENVEKSDDEHKDSEPRSDKHFPKLTDQELEFDESDNKHEQSSGRSKHLLDIENDESDQKVPHNSSNKKESDISSDVKPQISNSYQKNEIHPFEYSDDELRELEDNDEQNEGNFLIFQFLKI